MPGGWSKIKAYGAGFLRGLSGFVARFPFSAIPISL